MKEGWNKASLKQNSTQLKKSSWDIDLKVVRQEKIVELHPPGTADLRPFI